jgi:hypothetical protein
MTSRKGPLRTLISAYFKFPLKLPLPLEAVVLVALIGIGVFAIYERVIRPVPIMRILFGLKAKLPPPIWRRRRIGGTSSDQSPPAALTASFTQIAGFGF